MIQATAKDPQFRFQPLCKSLNLMSLMFADDLVIFCKGNDYSVAKMTRVLEEFARTAGLHTSHNKSNLYMRGLTERRQQRMLEITGFQNGSYPMRCLGLPISASSWNK